MYDGTPDQIFQYHVYANGCGGVIRRNGQTLAIPTIGSTALTSAGGETFAEQGHFQWSIPGDPAPPEGFRLSVDRITTHLWTEDNEKEWVTNAEVRVYGFNLCDRVKVGLMVNRLTSRHPKGVDRARLPDNGQPRISFAGSQFWNVSIDGDPVHITTDNDLDCHGTHMALRAAIDGPGGASKFCPGNLCPAEPNYMHDLATKYRSDRYTRCSIVGEVRHPRAHGYSVDLTDPSDPDNRSTNLGRVFFGELLVGDEMKHLSMIRWDLGCTTDGDGYGGSANMNGLPMP